MTRSPRSVVALLVIATALAACAPERDTPPKAAGLAQASPRSSAIPEDSATIPDSLVRLETNGDLLARNGDAIVTAPPADIAVLRGYSRWVDKGPSTGASGERLTILVAKTVYGVDEEVRVIHVHEATLPGAELYVMGPKEIFGEYIDGKLASKAATAPLSSYDGAVLKSPGEDHNYEVSVHHLGLGTHTLQWRFATLSGPTVLQSNVLRITVR